MGLICFAYDSILTAVKSAVFCLMAVLSGYETVLFIGGIVNALKQQNHMGKQIMRYSYSPDYDLEWERFCSDPEEPEDDSFDWDIDAEEKVQHEVDSVYNALCNADYTMKTTSTGICYCIELER